MVADHQAMEVDIEPNLIAGCAEALAELSTRYSLAIVSDAIVTPGFRLRDLLEKHGVKQYFSGFAFSDEVGRSKPHRDMFASAAEQLGVEIQQMIHIGDRDHNDIQGPSCAGDEGRAFYRYPQRRPGAYSGRRDLRAVCRPARHHRSIGRRKGLNSMAQGPKYLVIDGYTKDARDQLVSGGASMAADLYCKMLIKCSPAGAECDVLFPSDEGAAFPSDKQLASYDGIAWTGCSLCLNDGHHARGGQTN